MFTFTDPILRQDLETYPNLHITKSYTIKLYRIITGTANIEADNTLLRLIQDRKLIKRNKNGSDYLPLREILYNLSNGPNNSRLYTKDLLIGFEDDFNSEYPISLNNASSSTPEVRNHLNIINPKFNNNQNYRLYKQITNELLHCIISKQNQDYTNSFIYIYRLIELLAFPMPLLYWTNNRDFKGTYQKFKEVFTKDKMGELAFLKKFLKENSNENYKEWSLDFSAGFEIEDQVIDSIKTKYRNTLRPMDNSLTETSPLKNYHILNLIISLRNKFFHLQSGSSQENIYIDEVKYTNLLFKPLIDPGIELVSTLILDTIHIDISV